ncbi:diguanylate cyclase [Ramlibacter sp. USB13]|uniref:Diguanylate cyclase n=1 Tax=Ramlibacter cellulosilyticus TaxID=2764187 RepID=A0A923MUX9_9BURK|nr:7TM diverse intracellular signaling domain-containing protein [Ramlibacter cellulosilyticus]MBC5785178.1 diguanylate cyclase [Ramlibacter cellulosilyticus]
MARLLAVLCVLLACLQAAAAGPPAATVLRDEAGAIDAQALARSWVDARGDATLAQVMRHADDTFQPAEPGTVHRLPARGALWLHLRLQRGAKERQDWLLKFPMPLLDEVTVFQSEGAQWAAESAGDTLAVARWPERGRYPFFRLDLPPGEVRDVFVRIQHATPANFPVELATEAHHTGRVQLEYLGLGLAFGALLLLIAGCIAMSWAYRERGFAWYAGYAALTTLAVASYTGVAGQFLWPGFGLLEDGPTTMLACAAVGAAMLFVRKTLGLRRRLPGLDRWTLVLGAAGFVLSLVPVFASKALYVQIVAAYLCLASISALVASAIAWWRGDGVARWVLAAQFPLVGGLVVSVARALGWADVPFVSQYVLVAAMAVEVPLMLVALFIRSRDRHGAEVREQALSTHDALTGLLAPHLFTDRLRQVVARYRRTEENAAIMYIDLVNHARIRDYFGSAAAEQSLLRSVIKLRRLLRDVDTVSRVGEARFAVILEGASARSSVSERATRLIAAGLMPLPGLKPEVTLQFHVAALLLAERPMEAEDIQKALAEQLARMSPRTRRPIRFLQPEQAIASEPGDSSLFADAASTPAAGESSYAPVR